MVLVEHGVSSLLARQTLQSFRLSVGARAGGGGGGDTNVCDEAERGQHRQPEGVAEHRHALALPSTLNSVFSDEHVVRELDVELDHPGDEGGEAGRRSQPVAQVQTWHMTDGLYGIVGRVDYGEEGGQDPEENARAHQRYRGDVQLVHQEGSLPVKNIYHIHGIMSLPQAGVEMASPLEKPEIDGPIGLVAKVSAPLTAGLDPVVRAQAGRQQRDAQAAHEEGDKDEGALPEIHGRRPVVHRFT